jgi:hypothetical protein
MNRGVRNRESAISDSKSRFLIPRFLLSAALETPMVSEE